MQTYRSNILYTQLIKRLVIPTLALITSCVNNVENINLDSFNNFVYDQPQLTKGSEIMVIIPDTQFYVTHKKYRRNLNQIIGRINEINSLGYKVKLVLQVGDITDRNTEDEWGFAKNAFSELNEGIEYILAVGNHDYGDEGKTNNRETYFNDYINYENNKYYVESFEENKYENSYFEINIAGNLFNVFSLEFGPRDKVVAWADSIAQINKNKLGILLTHAYLAPDLERYDYASFGSTQSLSPHVWSRSNPEFGLGNVNDGQQLWDKLVSKNNFKFVVCGHRSKTGKLISKNENNQDVIQMIFAEHRMPAAIEGWIQFLEFHDDNKSVTVRTYSAIHNSWLIDLSHQYKFDYFN